MARPSLNRVDALSFALLAWRCHRLGDGLPNLRAQEKVYFVDPLVAHLPHLRGPRRHEPDDSQLTEQQLGMLLLRSAGDPDPTTLLEATTVMFERTPSRSEIDFVGPDLGVPFEAKYVDGPWRRGARILEARHGRPLGQPAVQQTPLLSHGNVSRARFHRHLFGVFDSPLHNVEIGAATMRSPNW